MLRNDMLSLPDNWEAVLEQMMLKMPSDTGNERIYICSPCRSDTTDGVIRNIKAARVYMFYAYIHFFCIPKAPHAYLPMVLNDNDENERIMALLFGRQILRYCDKIVICGDRLSEGMYGEIKTAVKYNIPIHVFNRDVHTELCLRLMNDHINQDNVKYDDGHLHFALAWGADELAPYWEGDADAQSKPNGGRNDE